MGMFFRLMSYVYENRIYAGSEVPPKSDLLGSYIN